MDLLECNDKVISSTIAKCCLTIVTLVYMDRVVLQMDRFLNSRRSFLFARMSCSDKVQISAANCISVMVDTWPEPIIKKHAKTFQNLIDVSFLRYLHL